MSTVVFRKHRKHPCIHKLKLDHRIMVSIAWNKEHHSSFETIVTDLPTGRILFIIEDPPAQDVAWDNQSGLLAAVGTRQLSIYDLNNYGKLLATAESLFDSSGDCLKVDGNFISVAKYDDMNELWRQA